MVSSNKASDAPARRLAEEAAELFKHLPDGEINDPTLDDVVFEPATGRLIGVVANGATYKLRDGAAWRLFRVGGTVRWMAFRDGEMVGSGTDDGQLEAKEGRYSLRTSGTRSAVEGAPWLARTTTASTTHD